MNKVSTDWTVADRISDQIIDVLNREVKNPGFSPVQALAGQLLALLGFMNTAPPEFCPPRFVLLKQQIHEVLDEILASHRLQEMLQEIDSAEN